MKIFVILMGISVCLVSCRTFDSVKNKNSGKANGGPPVSPAGSSSKFLELCNKSTDTEIRHTVTVIMENVSSGTGTSILQSADVTDDSAGSSAEKCAAASSHLAELTGLSLAHNQIVDLSPLEGLTNLTWLNLGFNKIVDITPMAGLTSLTRLELGGNKVSNIAPLSGLQAVCWSLTWPVTSLSMWPLWSYLPVLWNYTSGIIRS